MRLRLLITLTLALCARASLGQQPATQTSTFRTGIDLVELDVRVTDASGSFVPGLTGKDFEILEDGQPQTVAALSLRSCQPLACRPRTRKPGRPRRAAGNRAEPIHHVDFRPCVQEARITQAFCAAWQTTPRVSD